MCGQWKGKSMKRTHRQRRHFKIFSPFVLWKFCRNKTEKYKNSKMTLCSIRSILRCEYAFKTRARSLQRRWLIFCVSTIQFSGCLRPSATSVSHSQSKFIKFRLWRRWRGCNGCDWTMMMMSTMSEPVQLCNQITIVSFSVASSTFCGVVHCMPFGLQSRRCHKMPPTALSSHATIRCVMGTMYASSRPSKYIKINCAERYM